MERNYQPVGCDFHDELEVRAVTRKKTRLVYHDQSGNKRETNDIIVDIYTREHQEFIRLQASNEEVRLDDIVSVDGKLLSRTEPAMTD